MNIERPANEYAVELGTVYTGSSDRKRDVTGREFL